jgi:hypothetical protein
MLREKVLFYFVEETAYVHDVCVCVCVSLLFLHNSSIYFH